MSSGVVDRGSSDSANIFTNVLESSTYLKDAYLPPIMMQEKIDKQFDVRITVLGSKMIAVSLVTRENNHIDIRYDNMSSVIYNRIEIPTEIKECILKFMHFFSLNYGAFDFIIDKNNNWIFIEVNPNGQWAWMDSYVDFSISNLFVEYLNA